MQQVAETHGFPTLCGCSSMVEQELPKLSLPADFRHMLSKKRSERAVLNQSLSAGRQNSFGGYSPDSRACNSATIASRTSAASFSPGRSAAFSRARIAASMRTSSGFVSSAFAPSGGRPIRALLSDIFFASSASISDIAYCCRTRYRLWIGDIAYGGKA